MQVTIRFTADANVYDAISTLKDSELNSVMRLIGGFIFDTNRTLDEVLADLTAAGFERKTHIEKIEFCWE